MAMKATPLIYCENDITGEVGVLREIRRQFDGGKQTSVVDIPQPVIEHRSGFGMDEIVGYSKPYRRDEWKC